MNLRFCLITVAISLLAGNHLHAQSFSIDWFTIDGGGGTSSGGNFAVTGTIGQPDTGTLTGGAYTLRGGFWGAFVPVQVDGVPLLVIEAGAPGSVTVRWDPDTPGYVLEYTDDLGSGQWTEAAFPATNPVTILTSPEIRFFRLR
jgi:hypothetical protein